MRHFWLRLAINALALIGIAYLVPGIHIGPISAIVAALVLGAVNAVLRPVLILLTLPVTILTLGLFLLVLNAGMFGFSALLVPGFRVDGFWAALGGSILYSLVGWATSGLFRDDRRLMGRGHPAVIEGRYYNGYGR